MPDGGVEVFACGSEDAIETLTAWLQEGPRMASVTGVHGENVEYQEFEKFSTA